MRPFASISQRTLLLLLTLAGCWSFWMTTSATAWAFKAPARLPYIIRYGAVDGLIGLATCAVLFFVYDRLRPRFEVGRRLLVVLPLCFAGALVWHATSALMQWTMGLSDRVNLSLQSLLVGGGVVDATTLALFSLLFFAVDHWLQLREQREHAREATALAHQSQLEMLRYQLNPHFLFNALNSIRAMILQEPVRARQIVTELSEFLRYSLQGRGPESTLSEEMQAIENYLAIQRIRFEEKLVVTVRVDAALEALVLPCFLVHPLVENAVKYGMETSEPPLRVEIEIVARGPVVTIRVSNTGRLVSAPPPESTPTRNGTGTGLKNVARRLELAYPKRHTLGLTERDGWVHAEITLRPIAQEEAATR